MPQKVLFFLNTLKRTGSETIIFQLICDLHQARKVQIGIVLKEKGGDLVAELPADIPVYYLDHHFSLFDKTAFHFGVDVLGNRLKKIQESFQADLWYFNTVNQLGLLKYKTQFDVQAWVHIHELLYNFDSVKKEEVQLLLSQCDQLIACSDLVKDIFKDIFKGPLQVINSTINSQKISANLLKKQRSSPDSKKLKVVTAGTLSHIKGAELFYEVAAILSKDNFEFIWIGDLAANGFAEIIYQKNLKAPQIKFISAKSDEAYLKELAQADIFFSSSRSESMGLVMLEAAALNIPVFALNSGGARLIVNESNGHICYDTRPEIMAQELKEMSNKLANFHPANNFPFPYETEINKFIALFNA